MVFFGLNKMYLIRLISGFAAFVVFVSAALPQTARQPAISDTSSVLVELGKRLFYDKRLSGDASLSCASCHHPDKAFTDGQPLSSAYSGSAHFRNTPTLVNVGNRAAWMHDGRLGTDLNDVTREMITESYLMNMDMRIMQERLKQDPVYVDLFGTAALGEPSNSGARQALVAFMETIVSHGAAIDTGTLTPAAQRGQVLFDGRAGCARCHAGPRFTDDRPHNTGVPDNPEIWADPKRHSVFVAYAKFMGVENYMALREDLGAFVRTHSPQTRRSFLTPTLRELKWTAPYMHNGVFESLEQVVDFYDSGGGSDPLKDSLLQSLGLLESEKSDLVSFLEALSGESFDSDRFVWQTAGYNYVPVPFSHDVPN